MNSRKIILLIIVFQLFYFLANAQIKLIGNITTNGIAEYPTHIDSLSKGGYMSMPTIALRDAIPALRRKYGMLVFVEADGKIYKLNAPTLTNADWVELSLGSSGSQYTDALARSATSLTVTGSSGAATYSSTTGVFNIPNYTLSGLAGSQTANRFYAAPDGSNGTPDFRNIVAADIPTLNQNTTGNAATAIIAGNITATSNTTLTSLSNLNTVGTISSGVWSGTTIAVNKGGTGLTSAGTNGQVLTSNGDGTLIWSSPGPVVIGQSYQGGIVAYILQPGDPGYDATKQKGLIASVSDQGSGIRWWNGSNNLTGATGTAIGTGLANTLAIISVQGETTTSYAAGLARSYNGGGYTDWFLPSKDELNKLWINRASIGGFLTGDYWSSTENLIGTAWQLYTNDGVIYGNSNRMQTFRVRPIRTFSYNLGNSAILTVANGGTGVVTLTGLVKGNGTSAFTKATAGSDYQAPISLTTSGTGAATFSGTTLNIPSYTLSGLGGVPYTGATGAVNLGAYDLSVNGLTIGKGAGVGNGSNTAIGINALVNNTDGSANTASGSGSLRSNTTGVNNTATGVNALFSNNTGSNNTASGYFALKSNTSGANNTAFGYSALNTNLTGSNLTALGNGADVSVDGLINATAIGNGAIVAASNSIQLGNGNVTNVKTSGTITAGAVTYPNTHGTNGQVLSTTGSGTLAWTTTSAPTGASTSAQGIIQLAGDLGGTASSPTVNSIGGVYSSTISNFDTRITGNTNSITSNTADIISLNSNLNNKQNILTAGSGIIISPGNGEVVGDIISISTIESSKLIGTDIETVGTITSGVWSGTAVAVEKGGTGATTASAARTNLGLEIGANVQAPLTAGTSYIVPNASITGATNTKLTYDAKGLVTAGSAATTADIAISTNKNYVTDAQSGVLSNTSGTNTGDQTITLTGDVTGTGTGTFASTLANSGVSANSYGSSTLIPTFTVDAKGRLTTASTASIIADAGTLTGTSLNATLTGSSLTSVGTITSGVWSGTAVDVAHGGTGLTAIGSANQVLTSTGSGTLTWTTTSAPTGASTSAQGIIQLAGDLGGIASLPTVNTVGGVNSSTISSNNALVTAATNNNTNSAIVRRDGTGSFSAGTITAALTGNVTGNVTGNLTGNATTAGNITATSNTTLTSLSNLNTVGTITSGVWSGTAVEIANGGTGSTTKNFVDLTSVQTVAGAKTFNNAISGSNTSNPTIAGFSVNINTQTTNYTLLASDNGKIINFTNNGAITLALPVLTAGFNCMIIQSGSGVITLTGSSTTVKNKNSFTKTAGVNSIVTIIYLATNTAITIGDMSN